MLKKDLRLLYRKKRSRITVETIRQQSEIIASRLCTWLTSQPEISCIHSFLPSEDKKEVDTFAVIRKIHREFPSIKIAVPKVGKGDRVLSHHVFEASADFTNNRWGIPEPIDSAEVPVSKIDAVIIPLLIFDKSGHRVGYGGGFYDTFLAACRTDTRKVGLSLFHPVASISDTDLHDIRMNLCITPERTWYFVN